MSTTGRVIVIQTQDGRSYAGATPEDVVQRMLEGNAFTSGKLPQDYMRAVSRRAKDLDGRTVRHDSAEHFLADMESAGYITPGSGH